MQNEQPTSKRLTLIDKDSYTIDLEYNNTFAILHLPYVSKVSKEVLVDGIYQVSSLSEFLKTCGYSSLFAAVFPDDRKIKKLLSKLEFTFLGSSNGLDVYERKL